MSALHRRALLHTRRPLYRRQPAMHREICWMCKGLAVVTVPAPENELQHAQEPCANCAGRGYVWRES